MYSLLTVNMYNINNTSMCIMLFYFQLIDIVGSVLDRPLIKNEFTAKYVEIIVMLDHELVICEVSVIYFKK